MLTSVFVLVSVLLLGQQAHAACTPKDVITRKKNVITVDPFIVPSLNETNGSLPPGVCGFSKYPEVEASCHDTIVFVTRAIPSGLRAHGVYLVEDDFVDQATRMYRCPSTATDIDLRNGTGGGYANPGRCRAESMTQVLVDGSTNLTAPFVASPECSGYITIDPLAVFVPNVTAGCSTAAVKATECYESDTTRVPLINYVKPGPVSQKKTLVFACPNIVGNQPGRLQSHCDDEMVVVVHVTCRYKLPAKPKPCRKLRAAQSHM